MNDSIKNALGIAGILAVLLAGYAAAVYANAFASSIQPGSYRSFGVSGEGKVVVVPDIAQVGFTVITEGGKDVGALQESNTTKVNQAIDFVKAQGVDAKDVKTESYNVSPRYQSYRCDPQPLYYPAGVEISAMAPVPCPPSEIAGYTVTQSVSVKVRDFRKVGDILSGVVKNGANNVYGPNFTIDDPSKARDEARAEAIRKAQESAQETARAGGFSLGRLLSIDDGHNPYYYT